MAALAAPGDLDLSFNGTGKVIGEPSYGSDFSGTMVMQEDGKFLISGGQSTGATANFRVARYNSDGSMDGSFGTGGAVTTDFGGDDLAWCMAVASDGKIVVGGQSDLRTDQRYAIARYEPNGSLDSSFGIGGKVTESVGNGFDYFFVGAKAMVIQPDGKIVVGGTSDRRDFMLLRYHADGSLDGSFGIGGKVGTDVGASSSGEIESITIQKDGKIVVAGMSFLGTKGPAFAVARYQHNGSLDTSFGNDGKVVMHVGAGADYARSVLMQTDGKIVVGGLCHEGSTKQIGLVRYNADGSLDSTFGSGGKVLSSIGFTTLGGFSAVLQKDGRILVTTSTSNGTYDDILVERYAVNGSVDSSFGSAGRAITRVGQASSQPSGIVLQANGKIMVGGFNAASQWALLRYTNVLAPTVTTLNATDVTRTSATLLGLINANEVAGGGNATVGFELSSGGVATTHYGAIPNLVTGDSDTPVSYTLTDLIPGTDYYYYATSTNAGGGSVGAQVNFTTLPLSSNANLSGLTLSVGKISPVFDGNQLHYTATVPYTTTALTVTPTVAQLHGKATVNGTPVATGKASGPIPLEIGANVVAVAVTAQDGRLQTYTVTVTRTAPRPGDVDITFADAGRTNLPYGMAGFTNRPFVQRDGKIVMTGYSGNTNAVMDFAVMRFLANGSPDVDFGTAGKVVTGVGSNEDRAAAAVEQSDGRLLVAGYTKSAGGRFDFALVRYESDGTLDTGFGSGGKVITSVSDLDDRASSVLLQEDGKIIVAGYAGGKFGLVRYTSGGTLDASFGTGGKMTPAIGGGNGYASSVALQKDGKIVVAGGSNSDMAVVRYLTNGSLDKTFGSSGRATADFGSHYGNSTCLTVQDDGKILVAGYATEWLGSDRVLALARWNANGKLDASFGSGGKVTTFLGKECGSAHSMAVQKNGRIVVSAYSGLWANHRGDGAVALLCYLPNGSLDNGFGSGGKVMLVTDLYEDGGSGMVLQDDGKVVMAALLDDDFGQVGITLLRFHGLPYQPEIAVQSPVHTPLADGAVWTFAGADVGLEKSVTFTLGSVGAVPLSGISITIDGPHAPMFSIVTPPVGTVAAGKETTFAVRYAPGGTGQHTATLRITSNDADESPFDLVLKGFGVKMMALPVTTLAATDVMATTATVRGTVDPKGTAPGVWFDYGTTTSYGSTLAVAPETVTGEGVRTVSADLSVLVPHTKYYFRLRSLGSLGEATAAGLSFTTGNRPPVAVNDSAAVLPGATVPLNVLVNDLDADGDAFAIVSVGAVPAAKGKVTKVNNALVFTAASTFNGATFTYVMKDGFGGTATGTVTLTVGTASIDPPEKELPSEGGAYEVLVTAAGAWSVNEALAWVSSVVTAADKVQIIVQPNAAKAERTVVIKIAGVAHEITQAGVETPGLTQPALVPDAMVSANYALAIPTTHGPVTYTVTNLPPGLTINQATGVISGKPTTAGEYDVTVKARNAAGPARAAVNFTIEVGALPEEMVGTYHGYISGDAAVNGLLGSRFEMTTTATGAVSGKVINGAKTQAFAGKLDASLATPDLPQFNLAGPLNLALTLDAGTDSLTGTMSTTPVVAWRQVWKMGTKPATAYKGLHTFFLTPPDEGFDLPQGHGFGSFSVDEKNGALKVAGKLADGNAILTATFLGSQGQVLIYQPLYANKGSFGGVLQVAANNRISGTPVWFKPAATARETVYRLGFGPLGYTASGGAYPELLPGDVVLGLPNSANKARLDFALGGLEVEDKEFGITFSLLNPKENGLTNVATFPEANSNKVTMPTVNTTTGAFTGEFSVFNNFSTKVRKVAYQGQIVQDASGIRGYGFFLLPEPATPTLGVNATPKYSGRVILRAAP